MATQAFWRFELKGSDTDKNAAAEEVLMRLICPLATHHSHTQPPSQVRMCLMCPTRPTPHRY